MERKQIVILIGPPGSGKGSQADLLAEDFGFFHLETSKIIEEKFKNAPDGDPVITQAKEAFRTGKLVDSQLVTQWVTEYIKSMPERQSIVFSGSFRATFEAEAEIPLCEELYGKENIHVMNIEISEAESIKRNSKRRICKANRHPIPNFPEFEGLAVCPKDGSEIETRILDNPETIKVRYATYLEETKPVLEWFIQHGYPIIKINGEQPIRKVHVDILTAIDQLGHTKLLEKLGE